MIRRTRRTSCRSGRAIVAAAAAPSVREASHDGASTDGAAAAPTAAQARPRGHQRMAMHVASNAAALDWPKRLFWVSQKLKLGARRSEKPLFFIDFFLYFHFSFLWELALWSPS